MAYETQRIVSTKAGKIVCAVEGKLIKVYHRTPVGEELILSLDKKEAETLSNAMQDSVFDLDD